MALSRRNFLKISSLASTTLFMPEFLKAFERRSFIDANGKILIVIQLSGGNDGLNTIIPYRNDIYYKSRPMIGIKKEDAINLTDDVGLNPALKNIKSFFDQGYVSIINNVGYPEPDRSHFRSMDIWQSGSSSDKVITTGWLGRYFDSTGKSTNNRNSFAIEVDDTLSLAMKGENRKAIAVSNIDQFYKAANNPFNKTLTAHSYEHDAQLARYLYQTLRETTSSAEYIYEQSKIYNSTQVYPDTALGKRMKTIGSLINSGTDTKVYYVSHGSFDTHVNQKDRQQKLFEQLDDAIAAIVADLKQNNRFKDVLIMTFSEFGRRVEQNASNGTDHGTANNMFFISENLKKQGLYNPLADLTNLDEGDLKYQIDFKEVYSTVLNNWLNTNYKTILDKEYKVLDFV
jgi:uncharacterized protein (DUF1501 family)